MPFRSTTIQLTLTINHYKYVPVAQVLSASLGTVSLVAQYARVWYIPSAPLNMSVIPAQPTLMPLWPPHISMFLTLVRSVTIKCLTTTLSWMTTWKYFPPLQLFLTNVTTLISPSLIVSFPQ